MTILAYWCIAWISGIWLSSLLAIPLFFWVGGAILALPATLLTRQFSHRLLLSCVFLLALGGSRLALAQPRSTDSSLARYNDKGTVTLTGVVAAEPDVRSDFVFYKLDAESLKFVGSAELVEVHGAARVGGPSSCGMGQLLSTHSHLAARGCQVRPSLFARAEMETADLPVDIASSMSISSR